MIKYSSGNIAYSNADCIVNPVSCDGVVDDGICGQVMSVYPKNYRDYCIACKTDEIAIGRLHFQRVMGKQIINFPIRKSSQDKIDIKDIESGLAALADHLPNLRIKSIAIAPIGAEKGQLKWGDVKNLIEKYLGHLSEDFRIEVYEP